MHDKVKYKNPGTGKSVVNLTLKNYASDPLFSENPAEAKAEIDRVGLPKGKK
jgi:hypothetical protein